MKYNIGVFLAVTEFDSFLTAATFFGPVYMEVGYPR